MEKKTKIFWSLGGLTIFYCTDGTFNSIHYANKRERFYGFSMGKNLLGQKISRPHFFSNEKGHWETYNERKAKNKLLKEERNSDRNRAKKTRRRNK